ncbi:MAG: tetratricopeptide repeat protein [Planctomycetes bacterium]|nr:tetratricopeptide repeat protein [Planctomycetota bacterium]
MDPTPNARSPSETFQAAVGAFRARDWSGAESLCDEVLLADPTHADALHMLGLVFGETGRPEEAIAKLRQAIAQQPGNAVLWTNLGLTLSNAGRFADAIECQRTAIGLAENFPEAHYHLSLASRGLGQFEQATAAARRAIELRPRYAEAWCHLGNLLREEGRFREAIAAYQAALQVRPDWCDAHINIAAAWRDFREPAKALAHYREALRLEPASSEIEHSIGQALMDLGRVEEARAAYARAAADERFSGDPINVLVRGALADVIPPDHAPIADYRARLSAILQSLAGELSKIDLSNLHTHGAVPSAMLLYHGGHLRPLLEQYAHALGRHVPRLSLHPRPRGRPKLGIVVTNTHERVFARCWGGIAQRLSRELLDVRLVCSRAGANILQSLLKIPEHEYLRLPTRIDEAAREIARHEFDWLHYWEIGTDAMNYYLPFFRPAPGQSTCWGWPVTSGNPLVDSYLSCAQLEPPDGVSHYTEQLVLLKHLPTYYLRPPAPLEPRRSSFGLDEGEHVYLCTQNLRKYHPDFDALLAGILRSDPRGVLVIIGDAQPTITELLLDRFRRTMPDVVSRVRVLPRMERDEYLALTALADAVLDTLHYGGGANTVYDAVAVGTPIVTLPGEFHRSRWAAAVNRRLGLERLIAGTPEEYVAKAVEVAKNADLRQALHQQILEAGAELFEDGAVVREHEEYFSHAIAAARAAC